MMAAAAARVWVWLGHQPAGPEPAESCGAPIRGPEAANRSPPAGESEKQLQALQAHMCKSADTCRMVDAEVIVSHTVNVDQLCLSLQKVALR